MNNVVTEIKTPQTNYFWFHFFLNGVAFVFGYRKICTQRHLWDVCHHTFTHTVVQNSIVYCSRSSDKRDFIIFICAHFESVSLFFCAFLVSRFRSSINSGASNFGEDKNPLYYCIIACFFSHFVGAVGAVVTIWIAVHVSRSYS